MTGTRGRPRFIVDIAVAPGFARKVGEEGAETLRAAALATLAQVRGRGPASLTLVVTGDTVVRALNRRFRDMNATTDVLSFPAPESPKAPPELAGYLGDIALSYPQATRQAAAAGHTPLDELQLLVVHGVLHLLGYEHARPGERRRMWAVQRRVLRALGATLIVPASASLLDHG